MHYLYIITNTINGKKYVGQTVDPKARWTAHKTKKSSQYISNAINKYGVESFLFEIVAMSTTQEGADEAETVLIKQYNTLDKKVGYNIKPGGLVATGWHHTEETKSKISATELGKFVTEETRDKMSSSQKMRIRAPEEFVKMSKTKKEKWLSRFSDDIISSIKEEFGNGVTIIVLSQKYRTRKSTISKIVKGIGL